MTFITSSEAKKVYFMSYKSMKYTFFFASQDGINVILKIRKYFLFIIYNFEVCRLSSAHQWKSRDQNLEKVVKK